MTIPVTAAGGLTLAQMAQAALAGRETPDTTASGAQQDTPISVRAIDPDALQAAMTKQLSMVGDLTMKLRGVTDMLATSLQDIVAKRPDLADAPFDFMTDDGRIKVVSKTMTDSDRAWIESTLNSNAGLVLATRDFHEQAVDIAAQGAAVRGDAFTDSDRAAASQGADARFHFMSLLNRSVADNPPPVPPGGHFTTQDGTTLTIEPSAGTARGTLALLSTARQLSSGAAIFVDASGNTSYGMRMELVNVGFDVLAGYTPDGGSSVGFHETA
ncbi:MULTISPECIES: hypothetical protein [Burkholderia]|uniref:hypothetical protein n=1 Tax=Burkholderia TaxID=32008 RepID=UPI000679B794|nr:MULTISPECIES: hypothetical protein [Burkholderia]KWU24208.1 hypothetical protein AS149_34505 [Burkholderia cenocepacia]OXI71966.1 hypothetical protein CFB44_26880 [Burkholderia sp. AU31280]QRR16235.1 hypothetical protein GJG85_22975 [Burkholderia sp. MS389]QVN14190.1 hypothetical protein JYG37_27470 [Burkholderia sp. LAS2]RQV54701.1 hypothetical protein DF024_32665 [Burkholderia cenocepacia]